MPLRDQALSALHQLEAKPPQLSHPSSHPGGKEMEMAHFILRWIRPLERFVVCAARNRGGNGPPLIILWPYFPTKHFHPRITRDSFPIM